MASNDEPAQPPLAKENTVAYLTRIVHAPALPNAQTPLRVVCLLVLAVALAFGPQPQSAIGLIAVTLLALSFGQVPAKK